MTKIQRRIGEFLQNTSFVATDLWLSLSARMAPLSLPPIHGNSPRRGEQPAVLFAACDVPYFLEHGQPLLASVAAHDPDLPVHIHLYDPTEAVFRICQQVKDTLGIEFSFTWEIPPASLEPAKQARYFASIRFARLFQLMQASGRDFFAVDVDSLVRGDLGSILSQVEGDLGLFFRLKRRTFDARIKAGALFCRSTPATMYYLHELSTRLTRHVLAGRRRWGLDQECIYWTLRIAQVLGPNLVVTALPESLLDWDFRDDSLLWTGKGERKKTDSAYAVLRDKLIAGRAIST
jgi:hypothetical protein